MSGSSGNVYSPSGTQQSAQNTNATSLLNQNTSAINGYSPAVTQQATDLTQQFTNNPYQPAAQAGANSAGAYGTGTVVPGQQQAATSLLGLGNTNASYAPQALAAGFDPQNALYNQQFQQNQDQQNAVNSMNGVAGTPYGAGVAGQSGQNFNLSWLNQALGRQATAAGTASTLTGSANTAYTGAANQGTGAMNTQVAASGLPSSTYGQNLSSDLAALQGQNTAVSGATGVDNSTIDSILQYLGYGTSASSAASQAQSSSLGGLGSLFGSLVSAPTDPLSFIGL